MSLRVSSPYPFGEYALIKEFLGIEKTLLGLRLFQHSNGRYSDVVAYSQYDNSHPDHLEGTSQCQVEECVHCLGLQKCREFVNSCYTSQHQENDSEAIQGNFILTMS